MTSQSKLHLRYTELHVTTSSIRVALLVSDTFLFSVDVPYISLCDVKGVCHACSMTSKVNKCKVEAAHNQVTSVESYLIKVGKCSVTSRVCQKNSEFLK